MIENLLYYSTNSYLSYWITKQFYNGQFYVWCSPVFNPSSLDSLNPYIKIPHSSSPFNIYKTFDDAVKTNDNGCLKIKENKAGLKKGALVNYQQEHITIEEFNRINELIDMVEITHFRPLIYLIPNRIEHSRVEIVPINETASSLSTEYRISDLKIDEFEIISF
jgi:hypothetical protein